MVRAKPASSKKQKRGVDFKKIKHKIGRKLPPPKNATNVQIKSKAIVLPEQSIASEKEGLAVNKKGLTLRELLQQTSHHNAKIRRAALVGIKDLILKYPLELKLHKLAVIEKLRERICDNDKMVRDTLYHLLKSVIFPSSKEEITAPVISLLMAYIFNAMTHMTVDVRLMAFKFFELLAVSYPSSFLLYAEKVLDNYIDILRNNQIYLVEKSKLINALAGLAHCLSLIANKGQRDDRLNIQNQEKFQRRVLHAYKLEVHEDHAGIDSLYVKLEELVPVLINCFLELTSTTRVMDVIDAQSFDCMLSTLQCIYLAIKSLGIEKPSTAVFDGRDVGQKNINVYVKKLWETFPVRQLFQSSEKDDDKYIILDIKIAEIFLCLTKWVNGVDFLSDKLVAFIEFLLLVGTNTRKKGAHMEKHIVSLLPFIPRLLSQITANGKARLLEAFTCSFKECRVNSRLFTAYLSVVEELLLVTINNGLQMHASSYQDQLSHEIAWMRELPRILLHLSDQHPSNTMVVLKVLLRIGQCSVPNSPLGFEYDALQFLLREFYAIRSHSGSINYGPFLKLPNDCKELALCCLCYFSSLTSDFLESLAYCCLCNDMEPVKLLRIIEVLQITYKSGRVPVSEYMSFLVTLVARFRVSPERFLSKNFEDDSNRKTFKSITDAVFGCLGQIGDSCIVLKLLFKSVLNEMLLKPPMDNFHGMLRMIITLDARLTKLSDEDIGDLSKILCRYMVDTASSMSEEPEVACRFSGIPTFDFCLKPCMVLLIASSNVLPLVLKLLNQFISEDCMLLPSESDDKYGMGISSRINAVSRIFLLMFTHERLHSNLSRNKAYIDHTLLIMHNLLDSNKHNISYEERGRLQSGLDKTKDSICDLWIKNS
ncbi:uncharacterized protein LOC141843383 [Curcuma longa]|uniref:uncharacterized protein LOC141843383 n=1 Tax=Curcuma longa TaxID=136217 RepID=UPI003D9DB518